jgi:hypothetical protein
MSSIPWELFWQIVMLSGWFAFLVSAIKATKS